MRILHDFWNDLLFNRENNGQTDESRWLMLVAGLTPLDLK